MYLSGLCAADADSEDAFSLDGGDGHRHLAILIELLRHLVGDFIAIDVCHADQVDGALVSELPAGIGLDLLLEPFGPLQMLGDQSPQTIDPVVADDKPQLEGTEAPTQRDVPVAVVDHLARFARLVAQVFGQDAERLDQRLAITHPEGIAIEADKHPLVRVEAVGIGILETLLHPAHLGYQCCCAGVSRIDMEPDAVLLAHPGDGGDRIDRGGGGGADGGDHHRRDTAGVPVGFDGPVEGDGVDAKVFIEVDMAKILAAETGDAYRLLDRRVRFG